MQDTKFYLRKNNFFKNSDVNLDKTIIFNATGIVQDIHCDFKFKINFKRVNNNLDISLVILAWSNEQQKNVALEDSTYIKDSSLTLEVYLAHYKPIIDNLLKIFKEVRYFWVFKEFFYQAENHTFIVHYKLLNLLPFERWQKYLNTLGYLPSLDINYIKNKKNFFHRDLEHVLAPIRFEGFYIKGVELSVDLSDEDMPVIDSEFGEMKNEEFIKWLDNNLSI